MPGAVGQSRDVLDGAVRRVRAAGETLMLHSPGEREREQTVRNPGTWCVLIRWNCQERMVLMTHWQMGWKGFGMVKYNGFGPHPASSWCRRVGGAATSLSVLVFSFLQNPSQV